MDQVKFCRLIRKDLVLELLRLELLISDYRATLLVSGSLPNLTSSLLSVPFFLAPGNFTLCTH